jgi:hypothetical protein
MTTGMRVQVLPADDGGCGWYRCRFPAAVLQSQGHNVELLTQVDAVNVDIGGQRRIVDCLVPDDVEVMVIQRPLLRTSFELIAPLKKRGVTVVVEVDDDFHAIPDGHACRAPGAWTPDRSPRWIKRACEEADLVTVTTPALAERYGAHGRVVVLPNMVPAWYLDVPTHEPGDPPVVGWTGSIATHAGDLESTQGGVAAALRDTGASFHVIGTSAGVKERLGLDEYPSNTAGWLPLDQYPKAYAGLDVAIVPLAANPFNEAKSDLKGLEASALGVPWIASPTGPYQQLNRASQEAGLIAFSPTGWRMQVTSLVRDPAQREVMAKLGREYVREHRTYEANAWRWMEAWSEARSHARSRLARIT